MKDWFITVISIIFAIGSLFVMDMYSRLLGSLAVWTNIIIWGFAYYRIFRRLFLLVDSFDMSNDLVSWIVRIVGGLGVLFTGAAFLGSLVAYGENENLIVSTPLILGTLGSFLLCFFSLYRANRRQDHLYINQ